MTSVKLEVEFTRDFDSELNPLIFILGILFDELLHQKIVLMPMSKYSQNNTNKSSCIQWYLH